MSVHHCHWPGCDTPVPPKLWGCKSHWFQLPKNLRDAIWASYRPGQEISKTPSAEYLAVVAHVQLWIRENAGEHIGTPMMKTLSILQPWAWLIVNGHKDIENRTWSTKLRGRFQIHAGKKWGPEQIEDLAGVRERFPALLLPDQYDLGGIVGTATITDCTFDHVSPWFNGPYGFALADAAPEPFRAYRGQLGFFDAPTARRSQ